MGAYISNQVKMHAYHLNFETLDNGFWNLIRENSGGIHQEEGQLEMAKIEIAFENFSLLRIFQPGQAAHENWATGKISVFLTSFECAFEPSTIKGSAFPILPPLEWAFEPSPHFFSSAPSSPQLSKVVYFLSYLLLSAPSSPHLNSFRVRLRALDHQR